MRLMKFIFPYPFFVCPNLFDYFSSVTFSSFSSSYVKTIIMLSHWHLQYRSFICDLKSQYLHKIEIFLRQNFEEDPHLASG